MNRRQFLVGLGLLRVAAKTVFLDDDNPILPDYDGPIPESLAAQLERVRESLPQLYECDDVFYATISQDCYREYVSSRQMRIPLTFGP